MKLPWQNKKQIDLLTPLEGYNRWAATYRDETNPIKNLSNELIEKFLPDVQGSTILDAGCGTGYFCQLLENRQPSKIVGVDVSPTMIEVAKKNCPSIEFNCVDISNQPLGKEQFDLVICALVLGHIASVEPAIGNMTSSLKKGGYILISDFHPFLTLHQSRRTFKDATGKTFEIQQHLHLFQDIIRCFQQQGIVLEALEEPLWNKVPVIYAMKAKKM